MFFAIHSFMCVSKYWLSLLWFFGLSLATSNPVMHLTYLPNESANFVSRMPSCTPSTPPVSLFRCLNFINNTQSGLEGLLTAKVRRCGAW